MMRNRNLCQVLFGACLASLCACSDDPKSGVAAGTGAETAGAVAGAGAGDGCSDAYRHFAVGPSSMIAADPKTGIAVRVMDGAVPPEYGQNTWTVALLDATTMAPAPNAHITWQCAYMSVHGHGSNPKSIENLGNGQYKLSNMNMRMFGPWEVKFWIDPTGQRPDYVPTSNILNGNACSPTNGVDGDAANIQIKACVPQSSD